MWKMTCIPLLILLFTYSVLPSSAEEKASLPTCPPFVCGNHSQVQFALNNTVNSKCGVHKLKCSEYETMIQFKEGGHWYRSGGNHRLHPEIYFIVLEEMPDSSDRCKLINDYSIPSLTDSWHSSSYNITAENSLKLYNCSHKLNHTRKDIYSPDCGGYSFSTAAPAALYRSQQHCSIIKLPFILSPLPPVSHQADPDTSAPFNFTFLLQIDPAACFGCHIEGGNKCHNASKDQSECLPSSKGLGKNQKLGLELGGPIGGIGIMIVVAAIILRLWKKHNPSYESVNAFLKQYGAIQNKRYNYKNIKKMTNSFAEKLGQGSFGDVYKGKLEDGSLVAVKMLNQSKSKEGQDFINEVATISTTSHVNVVTLLGFCFDGPKRALIYEFMPNGSLEKFIFEDNATIESSHHLDWETYYQISLGIARGLEYLHRGCNTRILHFDIKPHNILLDVGFVPKISDFGLAKICKREESIVSMLGPRGTPGYIAPEVFSRSFGSVSHKSDVYSYGMMILEMIGGRRNINIHVSKTSEIYFPHWIYKRLEIDEDLGLNRIVNEEDGVKVKKMIMVSLWCIQTNPSNRPTMSRVIEMLEGSMDSLEVPPKPYLYSPSRSLPRESSETFV